MVTASALRGILVKLRDAHVKPKEVATLGAQIADILQSSCVAAADESSSTAREIETFCVHLALCINAFAKQPLEVARTLPWARLAKATQPLLPKMPTRQMSLLLNAFTRHRTIEHAAWLVEACTALRSLPPASFSAADLALTVNALARVLHTDEALLLRLFELDAPPLVPELNAKGLASVAAGTARLANKLGFRSMVAKPASNLLQGIGKEIEVRMHELGAIEMAIATDAYSRFTSRGSARTMKLLGKGLIGLHLPSPTRPVPVERLGHQEVVMVLTALARWGRLPAAGMDPFLEATLMKRLSRMTGDELAVCVHSAGQLALGRQNLKLAAEMPIDLVLEKLRECDGDHVALFLFGFTRLGGQPLESLWAQLPAESSALRLPNILRVVQAAAKGDYRSKLVRAWLREIMLTNRLASVSDDTMPGLIYAQLHPYYLSSECIMASFAQARCWAAPAGISALRQLYTAILTVSWLLPDTLSRCDATVLAALLRLVERADRLQATDGQSKAEDHVEEEVEDEELPAMRGAASPRPSYLQYMVESLLRVAQSSSHKWGGELRTEAHVFPYSVDILLEPASKWPAAG